MSAPLSYELTQRDDGLWELEMPGHRMRLYRNRNSALNRVSKIRTGKKVTEDEPSCWTRAEDNVLKKNYNRVRGRALVSMFDDKPLDCIKRRARKLGLTIPLRAPQQPRWTKAELEIVTRCSPQQARELLPNRTSDAILEKRKLLGVQEKRADRYSDPETDLLEQIVRVRERLAREFGRTPVAIRLALHRYEKERARRMQITRAAAEATNHLSADVRLDVRGELEAALLAHEIELDEISAAVKRLTTKAYGRRHFSLDTPVGEEGGMNWIDTIESDRPHF